MPNRIRFGADFDDKVSGKLAKIRGDFDRLGKAKGFKSLVQGVGVGAGVGAFNALSGAASSAVNFLFDSIDASSKLTQSVGAVESVLGSASKVTDEFGKTSANAYGLSKRAVNELAAVTGAQLKSMGFSQQEAATRSVVLQKRAADLAATFGGPVSDAVQAISALLRGERDPIERYGVSIKDADVKARVAAKGLDTGTTAAKKHSDALAALELLLEQTASAQGQFARESNSAAGQQARLAAMAEETSAKFGEVLTPATIEFQRVVIRALDRTSISIEELEAAAAKGSQAAVVALRTTRDQAAAAAADLAGKVADRGDRIEQAFEDVGAKADDMASDVRGAAADIGGAWSTMVSQVKGDAQSLITDAFEPVIARDELLANKAEAAAARRVLASKTATTAEKNDARATLNRIAQDNLELRFELLAAGKLNKTEQASLFKELKERLNSSSGTARVAIQKLIDKYKELARLTAPGLTVRITNRSTRSGPLERQHGGPVPPGATAIVGEAGIERLDMYPGGGGYVTPLTDNGGGGGGTAIIQLVVDGQILAEVVDRRLSYAAARAPQTRSIS